MRDNIVDTFDSGRKVVDDDNSDCDDKPKRSRVVSSLFSVSCAWLWKKNGKMQFHILNLSMEVVKCHTSLCSLTVFLWQDATSNNKRSRNERGRGRVRGHGQGRGRRTVERETVPQHEKFEDESNISYQQETNGLDRHRLDNERELDESKESVQANNSLQTPVRNFDLNVGLDENGYSIIPVAAPPCPIKKIIPEFKHEECPGWPFSEIDKMGIDPTQLANFSRRTDDDEEDCDE
ncbi:hypothetical protein SLA2020_315950 [Shorea laevis]